MSVVDKFLLDYAVKRNRLDLEFESRTSRFRHAVGGMPSGWHEMIKTQYIAHRIFKQEGLIHKYLNHSAIKDLRAEQQNYLEFTAANPWRFSFSEVRVSPAKDFYEMEDLFTGEQYLLYSPSVSLVLTDHPVLIWFNLIGFNGSCWQTFGPLTSFQSFGADDIFFYATELGSSIASEDDLIDDVERNPVPYMMLMTGSTFPLVYHGEHEVVQVIGDSYSASFDLQAMKKDFRVEYAEGVFKLSHDIWSDPPHYAEVYHVEDKGTVLVSALTDLGYLEMVKLLKAYGIDMLIEPDIRVHLPMLTLIKKLLKKEPALNPHSELFVIDTPKENASFVKKLNEFMALALPYINSGKEPDVVALAKKVGIDPEVAKDLIQQSMESFNKVQK
jgi:hypothetical protein